MGTDGRRPSVFICGPISEACRKGQFDAALRRMIGSVAQELEQAGFRVLSAHREELYGANTPKLSEDVFRRDFQFARACSAMVVVLPLDNEGRLYRTDGTFVEIGWGTALQKPVVIFADLRDAAPSYLLDGCVRASPHVYLLRLDELKRPENLTHLLRGMLSFRTQRPAIRRVAFCCTSFGLGPVSKAVAVAEALRLLRPEYRLSFLGANITEYYARSSGVFDEVIRVDSDASPEICVQLAQDSDLVVNSLNLDVLSRWSRDMPPMLLLDSLAWMWPATPPSTENARAYFIQDYLMEAAYTDRKLPPNAVLTPPILSPTVQGARGSQEVEKGYFLVNLAGCRNPLLPQRSYELYVRKLATGIVSALASPAVQSRLQPKRVRICGNPELVDQHLVNAGSAPPLQVESAFLRPAEFLRELRRCEMLLTSPGLTATLEALALNVPCRFLLPQNYSQYRILRHYQSAGLHPDVWMDCFRSECLSDPHISEELAVREIRQLLERYLRSADVVHALQHLLSLDGEACTVHALRQRVFAWDGSRRVAYWVIGELEAGSRA